MDLHKLVHEKRHEILRIAERHGARNVRIFGSVARGETHEASDIDILVDMEPDRSLLDHAALWLELQELLGTTVDVVSAAGLRPGMRGRVLQEAVPL
jgi:uncharacterized protein